MLALAPAHTGSLTLCHVTANRAILPLDLAQGTAWIRKVQMAWHGGVRLEEPIQSTLTQSNPTKSNLLGG